MLLVLVSGKRFRALYAFGSHLELAQLVVRLRNCYLPVGALLVTAVQPATTPMLFHLLIADRVTDP